MTGRGAPPPGRDGSSGRRRARTSREAAETSARQSAPEAEQERPTPLRARGGGACRIGTSGYQYRHWRGALYPEGLPQRAWFAEYARHFDTVEINNTFYRLPEPATFTAWRRQAPDAFCYALKYSRFGTHLKHLKDPATHLPRFLERAERLRGHLGPILVQLPPRWRPDPARLEAFLAAAPRDRRWAVELRHRGWLTDEVYAILEAHGAALVIHDGLPDHPRRVTADWIYLRFHGDHYGGSYSSQFLSALARRIQVHLDAGRDVYAYFNNDLGGHAVRNALDLRRYLARRPAVAPR